MSFSVQPVDRVRVRRREVPSLPREVTRTKASLRRRSCATARSGEALPGHVSLRTENVRRLTSMDPRVAPPRRTHRLRAQGPRASRAEDRPARLAMEEHQLPALRRSTAFASPPCPTIPSRSEPRRALGCAHSSNLLRASGPRVHALHLGALPNWGWSCATLALVRPGSQAFVDSAFQPKKTTTTIPAMAKKAPKGLEDESKSESSSSLTSWLA